MEQYLCNARTISQVQKKINVLINSAQTSPRNKITVILGVEDAHHTGFSSMDTHGIRINAALKPLL